MLAKRKLIVRIKPGLPVKYLQVGQKERTLLVILLELGPLIPWGSFIVFEIFKVLNQSSESLQIFIGFNKFGLNYIFI